MCALLCNVKQHLSWKVNIIVTKQWGRIWEGSDTENVDIIKREFLGRLWSSLKWLSRITSWINVRKYNFVLFTAVCLFDNTVSQSCGRLERVQVIAWNWVAYSISSYMTVHASRTLQLQVECVKVVLTLTKS